ncbi:MAG: alpha/beta hydrolase family protein [Candidatus Midichloriaceae bacterium]
MNSLNLSSNLLYQKFAERTLCYAVYGGADFGECIMTMQNIGDGDVDCWYNEWLTTASRIENIGDQCLDNGHVISAREAFLRASNYYRTAYIPLFGKPIDQRLISSFNTETKVFQKACSLFTPSIEIIEIPFDNITLPAYFVKVDNSSNPRPTVIHTNGYDSNIQEMYFAHANAAIRRGYNCLLFDGPGQGRNLIQDKIPLRHDWENIVSHVIEYASSRVEINSKKITLVGWSFGGFLASRAAAFEHRIAALIADPGQWDLKDSIFNIFYLTEEDKNNFPNIDLTKLQVIENKLRNEDSNSMLKWSIIQRGFWVNDAKSLFDYIKKMLLYEISPVVHKIKCPTLITYSENDPLASNALKLYKNLMAPKKLIPFTAAEGSGGHCQMMARSLYHQRVFDWLDEILM